MTQRGLADVRAPDDGEPRPRSSPPSSAARAPPIAQQLGEPVEQVAGAAAVGGRDGDRLAEAERVELGRQRLLARGRRPCWRPRPRAARRGAGSRRPRRRPGAGRRGRRARARPRRRRRSPRAPAPWTARESESSAARSTPPVSMSSKRTPFHSHSSALRSRVTPASLWTTASRPPTSRLTSVDLPTLGKPTTAIRGRRAGRHRSAESRARAPARPPASTTSSTPRPVVSSSTASSAARSAPCSRSRSRAVALALRGEHRRDGLAGLRRAPPGPLRVAGDQEDLERRVGADHGADVAALGDVVARRRSARAGARPSPRGRPGWTETREARLGDLRRRGSRRSRPRRRAGRAPPSKPISSPRARSLTASPSSGSMPGAQRRQRDAAVHRARSRGR